MDYSSKVYNNKNKNFHLEKNESINNPIHLKGQIDNESIIESQVLMLNHLMHLNFISLKLRKWDNGNYIHPLGMSGQKK